MNDRVTKEVWTRRQFITRGLAAGARRRGGVANRYSGRHRKKDHPLNSRQMPTLRKVPAEELVAKGFQH